jgi:GxxExxY protein
MHPLYDKASALTGEIIAAEIEVHRILGPGLLESVYEWAIVRELGLRHLSVERQKCVRVEYKGESREELLRFDVVVEACVLVEVKAVESVLPIHKAVALSYMRMLDLPLGLILNFNESRLVDGVSRLILPTVQAKS